MLDLSTKLVVLRLFFAISILLLTHSGFYAQENHIVVDNKIWSIVQENCLPEGNVYTTLYHRFEGDTLIDGKHYKRVLFAEDELYQEWFFSGSFVRETEGKVYLREFLGSEGLIYDFNLQPGDTITINNPLAPDGLLLMLTEIDSVETLDGYRTRWKLEKDEFSPPEYWIEGIGSQSGVLNSGTGVFGPLCGSYTLLCEKEDDITIYQNPEYETCFYILLDVDDHQQKNSFSFEIRHITGEENVIVLFDNNEPRQVFVTSITGKHLLKNQTSDQQFSISGSTFTKGLNIITSIQDRQVYSRKVMIY